MCQLQSYCRHRKSVLLSREFQLEKKRGEETCVIHQRGFTLNALEMEVLDAVYHHFQTRLYRGQKEVDRMRYVLVGTCMILLL